MGHSKQFQEGSALQYRPTQEIGKISNKQHNLLHKGTRKRIKSRVTRSKKIIKIRMKISGIETKKKKKTIEKINEIKSSFFSIFFKNL